MAERIEGLSIELDLETMKVNSGLKDLKSTLTTVNSEMKANMSAFDRGDRSVAKYETRLTGLNKKLEVQKAVTESARKTYEKMVKEHGEGSQEAQKAAREYNNQTASLNNLQRYIERTTQEMKEFEKEQRIASSNWTVFGSKLEDAGSKMRTFGDNLKGVGNVMSVGVTAPILGLGAAIGVAATGFDSSTVKIRNSLGLTAEEAEKLTSMSRNIYKDGFGESAEEIDNALLQTKQNIRGINDEDLERITKKAYLLADTFESDVNEVTRAGNNLMKGFGIESDEAFDLMAKGAQNGLNFSNEMFDNLSEYSTLFGNMGFTAEEYFQLLSQGMEAGAYNLDYINDVMKEFQIRVKDGSDTTKDAMGELSKDTQKVWKEFQKGDKTVKDVSNAVLSELEGMDDQVKANEIGVQLYGTKWEDLESEAMYALGGIDGGLKDVEGSMDEMTKNAEQSISQQWKSTWREAKEMVLPLGETLLDFTREILPDVKEGIEDVSDWFSNLDEEGRKNVIMFGGIAAAAGPLLTVFGHVTTGVGTLVTGMGALSKKIGKSGGKGTAGALSLLSKGGVAGLAIAGIAGVTLTVMDLIKESKEAEEVNLDVAKSLSDQASELENSANTFDKFAGKAKISNEQLAELNDLNIRISESSNPGEINELQKQYDNLAKKSGLSKDELEKLFDANADIIEQSPNVQTSVSETGNAFANNTDAVREYIDSLHEATLIELEAERTKSLEQEKEIRQEITNKQNELNGLLEQMGVYTDSIKLSEDDIAARIEEINGLYRDSNLSVEEKNQLQQEQTALLDIQSGKYAEAIEYLQAQVDKKRESIGNSEEELEKINALNEQMANLVLKQAGINESGEKGLAQLDAALVKNAEELEALEQKRIKNGELTEEEQKRYEKLVETNAKQQEAKQYLFEELGVYKDINSLLEGKLSHLSQEEQQKINNLAKTAEIKVEEGNIVSQIEKKNEKLLEERANLEANRQKQGANKEEIDKQIAAIDTKITKNDSVLVQILKEAGLWDDVKDAVNLGSNAIDNQGGKIDNNNSKTSKGIGLEEKRTKEAGKDIDKDVTVKDNGTVADLNKRSTEKKNKFVAVKDNGTIDTLNLGATAKKTKLVTLSPGSSLTTLNRQASNPVTKVINFVGRGLSKLKFWANGTPPQGHPGGMAVVGDGGGSELITTPNGKSFLSPPTDTLLNLPKGTHVIPHRATERLLKGAPKYAEGTNNWQSLLEPANLRNNEFMTLLALLGKNSESKVEVSNASSESGNNYIKDLLNATMQQNEILMQLLAKDNNTYLDSKLLGKATEPHVSEQQQRKQNRQRRAPRFV